MSVVTQSTPTPAHLLVYEAQQLPKLRSNYGESLDRSSIGWLKQTPADSPIDKMRKRYEEDGYIYVKGLLPVQDVLDVREAYFAHLAPTGILKPGTTARDGIFDTTQDPIVHNGNGSTSLPKGIERQKLLESAHVLPIYMEFVKHPKLRSFVREFMGWEEEVLAKRTLLRHNVPNGISTGVHYDRLFLRGGEAEFLTAWIPFGDCTAEGGGLMYWENSTDIGKAMEADFMKRAETFTKDERISAFNQNMSRLGHLSHDVSNFSRDTVANEKWAKLIPQDASMRWLISNFEAGDVVFHNPYLIHAAVKNEDREAKIRLAADIRFYEEGAPLDQRWMRGAWRADDGL
ncbi:hypothetical protein BAUCODRAFT_434805 [Baudoinia panamericana UAMH 10762]|uniref:Uncharacterized protein n=1 Tax=Baudoinia panamericana (strain UAMH 10762) TaxID=717646 RepID=M2MZE3_BAUPA|nr:uncharacterized protein BAUCODRAFT_434805 [Baudoinia panamericana UAMH 10762]EMC96978.1 hypothetical protein BAUCODRAFT_434805 [Baudoinia panamericana UAMH 10762]